MPKNLVPLSVSSPGFFGLNKQRSGSILPPGWATKAENFIFDDVGRLSSRKGYKYTHTTAISGTPDVKSIHEYVDAAGSTIVILAAGNKIYKINGTALTDITGSITTPTADNWKFQNFNGKCIGFQSGHAPIVLSTVSGSFANISLSGTQQPTTAVDEVISAYGRVWALDGSDLKYSDLLDETAWNGVFDLSKYWKAGMDEGMALADFNGYLVVMGKRNIIIYENPFDPASTMQIVENIGDIGCIARDSVQHIGTDVIFLSASGVRSLGRVIQEKSMPIGDISKNVRDDVIKNYNSSTPANIKSTHNVEEGFYLLAFPDSNITYCFDTKSRMQDGTLRCTEWSYAPTALFYAVDDAMYLGTAGYIAKYQSYLDGIATDGTGGSTYTLNYEGVWNDFGEEVSSLLKLPKKLSLLMAGVAGRTVSVKWAYDYLDSFTSSNITFPAGNVARYGIAQYGIDTYSGELTFDRANASMTKTGQVLKFGISTTVNAQQIALQRIDMLAKIGRIAI